MRPAAAQDEENDTVDGHPKCPGQGGTGETHCGDEQIENDEEGNDLGQPDLGGDMGFAACLDEAVGEEGDAIGPGSEQHDLPDRFRHAGEVGPDPEPQERSAKQDPRRADHAEAIGQ